jgi:hypothetical protein
MPAVAVQLHLARQMPGGHIGADARVIEHLAANTVARQLRQVDGVDLEHAQVFTAVAVSVVRLRVQVRFLIADGTQDLGVDAVVRGGIVDAICQGCGRQAAQQRNGENQSPPQHRGKPVTPAHGLACQRRRASWGGVVAGVAAASCDVFRDVWAGLHGWLRDAPAQP